MSKSKGTVYLIHFDRPLGDVTNPHGTAQHYIGFANGDGLEARLEAHRSGNGARIMAAVEREGIGWQVVKTWPGDRDLERRLKCQKHAARFCPICQGIAAHIIQEVAS
jgi:hypothetical protein